MKALSIQQPWAELIVSGKKLIENRTWSTQYRGPLIIHASKSIDDDASEFLQWQGIVLEHIASTGAIVGIAELVGCKHIDAMGFKNFGEAQRAFAFGPFCWILEKPRRTPVITYPGRLGLYDITAPYILEQLPK